MIWIEAKIFTTTGGIEPISGILTLNGVSGYAVEDKEDFAEFLEDKEVYWDYIEDDLMSLLNCETKITFYLTDDSQGHDRLISIEKALSRLKETDSENSFGKLELTLSKLEEEDWANSWKQYFKPFPVGKRLIVKPTWEKIDNADDRIILEIDPSSSFGTGSHTTTKMCLIGIEEIMEKFPDGIDDMLDVGCGSGILSIAANFLGANHITAIDIEENSIRVAKENFAVNHISEKDYTTFVGSITSDRELFSEISSKKYKLIAANIVSDVLIAMAPYFYKLLSDDGRLIISGIIYERAKEVTDAFEKCGFKVMKISEDNDWAAVLLSL